MSNILYVIDGFLSSQDKANITIELIEQLKKIDRANNIRKRIAKKYSKEISIDKKMPFDSGCSYHFYWILVKNRERFRKELAKKGIESGIHYKPIHTFSFYKSKLKLPITEKVGMEIVTLPTHPNLTDDDVEKVIKVVNKLL